MTNEMFAVVSHPPSCDGLTFETIVFNSLPATVHLISAGGLLFAVLQVSEICSPTFASVGPAIVIEDGETVILCKID